MRVWRRNTCIAAEMHVKVNCLVNSEIFMRNLWNALRRQADKTTLYEVDSGQWTVDSGQWTVVSAGREVGASLDHSV